jgi:hypothetical protein
VIHSPANKDPQLILSAAMILKLDMAQQLTIFYKKTKQKNRKVTVDPHRKKRIKRSRPTDLLIVTIDVV